MCIYGTYKYVLLQNHLNDLYTNETDAFSKLYCHSRKLMNQEICSISYVRFSSVGGVYWGKIRAAGQSSTLKVNSIQSIATFIGTFLI